MRLRQISLALALGAALCGCELFLSGDKHGGDGTDGGAQVDMQDHSCLEPTMAVGGEFTVQYQGQSYQFAEFDGARLDSDVYWFSLVDATNSYYLVIWIFNPLPQTCPVKLDLSDTSAPATVLFGKIVDLTWEKLARSDRAGSSGALLIDGFKTKGGFEEVSYSCTGCTLQPVDTGGQPAQVEGFIRMARPQ